MRKFCAHLCNVGKWSPFNFALYANLPCVFAALSNLLPIECRHIFDMLRVSSPGSSDGFKTDFNVSIVNVNRIFRMNFPSPRLISTSKRWMTWILFKALLHFLFVKRKPFWGEVLASPLNLGGNLKIAKQRGWLEKIFLRAIASQTRRNNYRSKWKSAREGEHFSRNFNSDLKRRLI